MDVLVSRVAGLDVHKDSVVASGLIAEMGTDMSVFPSADHAASWAGLAPGSHESAGKKRSARTRKGRGWLKSLLCEAAWGAIRTKTPTCAQSSTNSAPGAAPNGPCSRSLARSSWLRTGSSALARPTTNSAGTTSTDSICSAGQTTSSAPCRLSAMMCR